MVSPWKRLESILRHTFLIFLSIEFDVCKSWFIPFSSAEIVGLFCYSFVFAAATVSVAISERDPSDRFGRSHD